MPLEPRRVKNLFVAASELVDPVARQEFLDRECADDADLRRRLDMLLAAHDAPHAAVNQPLVAEVSDATATYQPAQAVGSVIAGKYKLLQEIGEGGMGSVFMADQTHPVKRRVAVKVIKAGMDSARVLARFEAERQALALMDHPNIAKVLEAGATETGRPYFVMELVKGIPLTQFCDEHKLPVRDRLDLFMQICSAVQHAHQKGIIHRDLKPTNLLVESHDGRPVPKVIDFGLAKATSGMQLTEHTLFTALGQVAGTPLYMAPEQAAFNSVDVDTRADVYALGVILYELLTGTTPIERETFKKAAFDEMLRVIREQDPPTPSSRLSSSESKANVAALRQIDAIKLGRYVHGELDWIVMKSLSKERDRRYESATAFAKDVERFLNHEPVQAGPPSSAYRLKKFAQRNRAAVLTAAVILFILLAGITGTTFGLIRAEISRSEAEVARGNEQRQRRAAEKLADSERVAKEQATLARSSAEASAREARKSSQELEKKLYVNLVGRAHSDWLGGSVQDALHKLEECPPKLRSWEWNFAQGLCHLDRWTDAGNGRCAWSVAVSPDGSQIACGSGRYLWATKPGEGVVVVRDATHGRPIFVKDGLSGGVHGVAFSPDGRHLACCTGLWAAKQPGELIIWDVATQERRWSRKVASADVLCVAYSPDGSKIAVGSGHYNSSFGDFRTAAFVHDATTGEPLRTFPSRTSVHAVAFTPDSRRLALGESEEVVLYNLEDGQLVRRFGGHTSFVYTVAFSPDGTRMATGEYASPVRIWDVESGKVVTYVQGDQSRGLAFDRDAGRLAMATGVAKTVRICDSRTGATLSTLRGHLTETMCVAFHPDGTGLVSGSRDGAVKMWNAKSQPIVLNHELRGTEHPWITGVAAERNGRRVITASRDNTVQVWDAERGDPIRTWEGPSGPGSNWM